MSSTQSTDNTRTRPFTYPEVLRAIAHTLARPGRTLTPPETIRRCKPIHATQPAAELNLQDGKLASVVAWAEVMDPVVSVAVIGGATDSVYLLVTGRLDNGPTVTVVSWVDDMPLEVRIYGGQEISMPELAALAAGSLDLSMPALVGAR